MDLYVRPLIGMVLGLHTTRYSYWILEIWRNTGFNKAMVSRQQSNKAVIYNLKTTIAVYVEYKLNFILQTNTSIEISIGRKITDSVVPVSQSSVNERLYVSKQEPNCQQFDSQLRKQIGNSDMRKNYS